MKRFNIPLVILAVVVSVFVARLILDTYELNKQLVELNKKLDRVEKVLKIQPAPGHYKL